MTQPTDKQQVALENYEAYYDIKFDTMSKAQAFKLIGTYIRNQELILDNGVIKYTDVTYKEVPSKLLPNQYKQKLEVDPVKVQKHNKAAALQIIKMYDEMREHPSLMDRTDTDCPDEEDIAREDEILGNNPLDCVR